MAVSIYDDEASEVWLYAKGRALQEARALTVEDLTLGALAVLKRRKPDLSLPPEIEAQVQQLQIPAEDKKVPVDESAREFHAAVKWRCEIEGRELATLADVLAVLGEYAPEPLRTLSLFQQAAGAPPQQPAPLPRDALRALERYTTNLTRLAAEGKLSPAYGRDAEREALVVALLSKTKPNVALVGPAGVGKTKLVEDLALRIYRGEIPRLQGYTVLQLNLVDFRAGAYISGEVEQRFAELRRILEQYGDRIILFIDELHTIVGTPIGGHTLDVANALKPMLTSGKVRCIGATTIQEYGQYIETDRALARRFRKVILQEPSREATRHILQASRAAFEQHHGVEFPDETIDAIIDLSDRFLIGRTFPDKAFDVLDTAGAWASTRSRADGVPIQVTVQDVYRALAQQLQIPVEDLLASESINLETELNARVIGQTDAAKAIATAYETRYRTRAFSEGVRLAMVFVGPPSTGKKSTARALAQLLCHNEKALLELDLRLLERRYSLSRDELDSLIGVKPPYVGWEQGGKLTNHVLQFPRSVIYVEGIETAPRSVVNLFRQILLEGRCTDGRGTEVNFRESIWIFAVELGETEERRVGFARAQRARKASESDSARLFRQLHELGFPTELLELDLALVAFQPLSDAARAAIARQALEQLRVRLHQMDGKTVEYDEELLRWLLAAEDGAPPQPEQIQRRVHVELTTRLRQTAREQPEAWAQATTVRLSLQPDEHEPAPPVPRVLVIDDTPDFFEALKATFPHWQWRWAESEDRADALLAEFQPHLALIDTCLSEQNPDDTRGVGLLQRLKQRFPQQTFVIVSAQGENFATTRDAFRAGAYDYMLKGEHSLLQELVNSRVQLEHETTKAASRQRALAAAPADAVAIELA